MTTTAKSPAAIAHDTKPATHVQRLRRLKAADYLRDVWGLPTTSNSLAKMACNGDGPVFQKIGRYPVYTPHGLDAWAESRLSPPMRSTSDVQSTAIPTRRV